MFKNRRLWWVLGGLALLIALAVFFIVRRNAQTANGLYETSPAARGSLQAVVGATGTVRANQSAALNWQASGTVEAVKVKVGDSVKAGDALASLKQTSLSQNIILAQADLLSSQRSLEDLMKSGTARAQAELALAQAEDALKTAKDKYEGSNFQRASDTKIENTQSQLDILNNQIAIARRTYAMFERLPSGDSRRSSALANLTNLELQRDSLLAELNYLTGTPDANEVAQRKANYELAQAQYDDALLRVERLKDGPDALELARLQAQITAAQATLNLAQVSAPFAGVITQAEPLPGDQVSPGVPAFRLDDLSRLLVDVQVSEIDINNLQVGQEVTLFFDAISGKSYNGKVVEVGRVGSVVQGAVEFTVTVELTDPDELVRPGMTAAVNVLVKQLDGVLLVPNRAVRVVDGERVVYVLKNGLPVATKIRLGATSDAVSEVVGGDLQEGDLIILNPPAAALSGPMGGGRPGGN
ncbi:MAG: efflux RND transporter periplasmic adaptor subunit [Anaerolineales bacterium]